MAMTKAEKERMERLERAAAAALYVLEGIAYLHDFNGEFANCDPLCGDSICDECGCFDHKRHDIRESLLPKTLNDFGYPEIGEIYPEAG